MPVTLESRARRMQVFHLPHEVYCGQRCTCAEVTVVAVAENPRTGERAPKRVTKKVPGSITILARERTAGLPSVVLEVADVKAAIGRGYLRVIEQTPDMPSAPTTSVPVSPASTVAPSTAAPNSPTAASPAPSSPTSSTPAANMQAANMQAASTPAASAPAPAAASPAKPPAVGA